MKRRNILVLVKTYPSISQKYRETVCTAGLLLDDELKPLSWIRVYPVRFRNLTNDARFKKWTIISADIERNDKDHRHESYRINDASISIIERIEPKKSWKRRRDLVFPMKSGCTSEIRERGKSIGLVRPVEIKRCFAQKTTREWSPKQQAVLDQGDLLAGDKLGDLEKIPYKFYYEFKEEDGSSHKYSILDWEISELFRKSRNRSIHFKQEDREKEAVSKVIRKLEHFSKNLDLHFMLGNFKNHPQNFGIIGLIYPPIIECEQLPLIL